MPSWPGQTADSSSRSSHSRQARVKGQRLEHASALTSFCLPVACLDNHVEYLALMSPHSTSISLLVWPDLAAVQYFLKNPSTKKRKAKVTPARPTLTRCSPAAIIVFAVLCGLPTTGEGNIHYCPNKAKGGACDWVGEEEVDGAAAICPASKS